VLSGLYSMPSGLFSMLKADTSYVRNGEQMKFAASGGTNIRYYPALQEVLTVNDYVGAALAGDFFRRTTVSVNETLAYAPSYLYSLFPGATTPVPGLVSTAGANYALSTLRSYTNDTTATLSQRLTPRATATLDADYRSTAFRDTLTPSNVSAVDVAGRVAYRFSRTGTVRAGYVYREGEYSSGFRATERALDIGLELGRPLSRTRRLTLRIDGGPTLISAATHVPLVGAPAFRQQYDVAGNGAISYDLGTTWRLQGSYQRGVMFVEGFTGPLTNTGYGAEVGGFINRRVDVLASAGYSRGQATFAVIDQATFNTRTVNLRLRYALGRKWAAYTEYLYYYYTFNQAMLVSPLFGPGLDRNGVHVGLTLWTGVRRK
jgi:hypothetical protein